MFLVESLGWMGINTPMNWRLEGMDPIQYVESIIIILIMLAGLVSAALIVSGAYTLITSSGDPENIAKGQKTITNAIIGLVLAALAFLIVNFAIDFTVNPAVPSVDDSFVIETQVKCEHDSVEYPIGGFRCENGVIVECAKSVVNPQRGVWIETPNSCSD